ncbi:MAG: histidine--tRNA ligase [Acidobacteria bacterium]|nr:histidine--tRNA ligase [Acidobacteriota bacterium]
MTRKKQTEPLLPRGMRDFLPEEMMRRRKVIETIREIFERYGYEPLETPALERIEVLAGKYGEEGEKLMFRVLKRGSGIEKLGKEIEELRITNKREIIDLALRYDLTVPLARVVALNQGKIALPFKRYQIQPVWRAERPQRGRYREFYQCDVDTVGSPSMMADAEIITIINEILTKLGFSRFRIRINNRKVLNGIAEKAGVPEEKAIDLFIGIDKLEKIGLSGVEEELKNRGIAREAIAKIIPILEVKGDFKTVLSEAEKLLYGSKIGEEGLSELAELFNYATSFGVPPGNLILDLSLARGLDYYTGPIYESVVDEPRIGSLTGGGRYDNLIGMFLGRDIPATGTSIGIERIIDALTELKMLPAEKTLSEVLVTVFDKESFPESAKVARELRDAGINTTIYFEPGDKLSSQLKYADKRGIPLAIIVGPDEIKEGVVAVKDLGSGKQEKVERRKLISLIKERIKEEGH